MQLSSYYNYIQEIQDNCLIADLSPINLNTSTLYEGKDKEMEQKLRHWAKAGQRPVRPRMGPLGQYSGVNSVNCASFQRK